MEFTAIEIASILDGQIKGDEGVKVSKLSKIEEGERGSISFLSNPKYENYIYNTQSSIVIINKDFVPSKKIETTLIAVSDAYQAFTKLLHYYNQYKNHKEGIEEFVKIHSTVNYGKNIYIGSFTYLGENVKLGNNVKIYPNSYIGDNVTIGDNTIIYAGVKLYADTKIGSNCIVHSGTVIGSDGFGFAPTANGSLDKIPQIGNVLVEDNVEIGSSCTIDRATMGSTIIRKGAKLDNQIQIAHNVEIDENTAIASQSGVAGSTKIGKNCMIGGQVGIAGHLKIGDFVQVQAQSGIGSNISNGSKLYGSPAIDASKYRKSYVYFRKFPNIVKRLEELENKLTNKK